MKQQFRIAIYMRLSKQDGQKGEESNSIRMQRQMLCEYVKSHFDDYELTEFQDEGYSGTNFILV